MPKQEAEEDDAEEDTDTSDPVHVLHEEGQDDDATGMHIKTTDDAEVPSKRKNALDRFLIGYVEFMSNALYQDRGLKLMQWTLWLASKAYSKKSPGREALHKLSFDLSFARYALRLLGLPTAIEAVRNDSWGAGWLGRTMAASMVCYYPLEHLAYCKWMAPKFFHSRHSAAKLSAWSCRFWLIYIMAELLQGLLNLKALHAQQKLLLGEKTHDETSLQAAQDLQIAHVLHSIRHQQLQVVRDLLFTVPCIQWSLPNWDTQPWLNEWIINGLMWLESVVCMHQSVQAFNHKK